MELDSKPFSPKHPSDAIAKGVFLVPEDRSASSMLPGWSIARTISLPFLKTVSNGLIINNAAETNRAAEIIKDLGVVTQGSEELVDALSGGNQQKVIVGRWLKANPKLLILDEPYRGVDIGARRVISNRARALAESGAGVIVLTSEVDELVEVADRVIVLVDGVPTLDTYLSKTSRDQIVETMSEVA
jgi:simple sugar transport system ATP-binding protein